jgi:hypothetical protein
VVKGVVIDHLIGDKMGKSRILMDSVEMMHSDGQCGNDAAWGDSYV